MIFMYSGRNDVWKYQSWYGLAEGFWRVTSKGLVLALGAMAVTIAADKVFGLKRDLHLPAHGHHHEDSLHD